MMKMKKALSKMLRFLCPILMVSWLSVFACQTNPVDYQSIDDLPNPGRGWTTLNSLNGEAPNRQYPPSTIAYYRFTWRQAEPVEGQYAFDALDGYIAAARAVGQRFAFRIMPDACRNGVGLPDWLIAKGVTGWYYPGEDGSTCFTPDAADPVYLDYARRLIDAFGARYNGLADIDHVDIGLVGDYGEWHTSLAASRGAVMPPLAVRKQYIDWHRAAFPDTPLLMALGVPAQVDADTVAYALEHGTGWRTDCWGDYRSPWNHMEHHYPVVLAAVSATADSWRTRPVALEICGVLGDWYANWPDRLDDAFQFAIDRHVSVLNAKSSPVPPEWAARFAAFTARIGYRFAFAAPPTKPETAVRGTTIRVGLTWTNPGNAPVYRPYRLAVRLTALGTEIARTVSAADVRTWMPYAADGVNYPVDIDLAVPSASAPGRAIVQTALLDPDTGLPAIRLAVPGPQAKLWYDVGAIDLQ
jgi:hypothetical protein